MSITRNSAVLRFLLAFFGAWGAAGPTSGIGRALDGIGNFFRRQSGESALCAFVWREGRIPRAWPHSLACGLFTGAGEHSLRRRQVALSDSAEALGRERVLPASRRHGRGFLFLPWPADAGHAGGPPWCVE